MARSVPAPAVGEFGLAFPPRAVGAAVELLPCDRTPGMRNPRVGTVALVALLLSAPAFGQGPTIPSGDKEPVLRLEAGGPTSFVTSLVFSPDGRRLYAAGFDKVVRVWALNAKTGQFELDRA